jgi:hypothetical protein
MVSETDTFLLSLVLVLLLFVLYFVLVWYNLETNNLIELSIAPELNAQIVPPHARPALEAQGLDINNLKPLSKEEMMAHLD